jgi:uncharacterized protein with PIN domain
MRKRTARRAEERARGKLARDVERLYALFPGGSPERPIAVVSPAEVEVEARSTRCPLCEGALKLEEHRAETLAGRRLRVAKATCSICRAPRVLYFELAHARLN